MAKDLQSKSTREPAILIRRLNDEHVAIRFAQIGDKHRFRSILQRFRADFLLATYQNIESQAWWIVTLEQVGEVREFARRNGLKVTEE
jgi:hypothetical protein